MDLCNPLLTSRYCQRHPLLRPVYSTFVCPTEIVAFSDRAAEFKAINTQVRFNVYALRE